jgi:hypothetical protein
MKMTVHVVAFIGLTSMLVGCASVPMAPADADAKAKAFVAPSDGHANLYVYRNETMGSAIKMPLLLDNASIGDTGPHTYVLRQIAAGQHVLVSKTEKDVSLDMTVEAGKNYYVWQEVKMGMWAARSQLHLEDESTGQAAVKECKLIE